MAVPIEILIPVMVAGFALAVGIWLGKRTASPMVHASSPLSTSLQLLQARDRAFFSESPFAIIVEDGSGNIIDANPIAGDYFSTACNRLKGGRLADLFPLTLRPHIDDLLAGGNSSRRHRVETKLCRPNRELFPVEIFCRRVKNGAGHLRVIFIRNITERKQREHELSEATRHLKFHLENGPLAYIEFDEKFRVTKWSHNAELMFGWKPGEVLGCHPFDWDFVFDGDAERMEDAFMQLSRGDAPARSTWKMQQYRKDGSILECRWFHSAERNDKGKPHSHFCLIRDSEDSLLNTPLEASGRKQAQLGETHTQELNLAELHRERRHLSSERNRNATQESS